MTLSCELSLDDADYPNQQSASSCMKGMIIMIIDMMLISKKNFAWDTVTCLFLQVYSK